MRIAFVPAGRVPPGAWDAPLHAAVLGVRAHFGCTASSSPCPDGPGSRLALRAARRCAPGTRLGRPAPKATRTALFVGRSGCPRPVRDGSEGAPPSGPKASARARPSVRRRGWPRRGAHPQRRARPHSPPLDAARTGAPQRRRTTPEAPASEGDANSALRGEIRSPTRGRPRMERPARRRADRLRREPARDPRGTTARESRGPPVQQAGRVAPARGASERAPHRLHPSRAVLRRHPVANTHAVKRAPRSDAGHPEPPAPRPDPATPAIRNRRHHGRTPRHPTPRRRPACPGTARS